MKTERGFTLLEVLLSSLIFTIVILAVLGTYSMLMNNYRLARHYIETTNRAHNIFNHFRENLVNVYPEYENDQEEMMYSLFRNIEDEYNIPRNDVREDFIWDLQHSHRYQEESVYGFADRDFGDFSFMLERHENNSLVSFSVYNKAYMTALDLGLKRLTYFVDDDVLYCYKQPVYAPFQDVVKNYFRDAWELERGELLPIAEGVRDFEILAHYYRDYEFKQAQSWDSNANKHVFPPLPEEDMMDITEDEERDLFPERDGLPVGVTINIRLSMDPDDQDGRLYSMYYDIPVSISSWYEDEYRYEHLYEETPYR